MCLRCMTALPTAPAIPDVLVLNLKVRDPEVVTSLVLVPEATREEFALTALRIGVLAKQQAAGQLDVQAIRDAGERLVTDLQGLLGAEGSKLTGEVAAALQRYLDPNSGVLQQRIGALVKPDGELSRVLEKHLGAENSMLAQTLVRHLGETSPLFRLLSPTDASGLKVQLERSVATALEQQRRGILQQFSLDEPQSALSRLVRELSERNGTLTSELSARVEDVVSEFSLDDADSALSRLVGRLDQTQKAIAREFTLDEGDSALSRMRRELVHVLEAQAKVMRDFQLEMRGAVESLQGRKEGEEGTPKAGESFESALGSVLAAEARRSGDICHPVGTTAGAERGCKVGDFVVQLAADHRAAGARIVWEAKAAAVTLPAALEELSKARRNREASLGVFVFERGHAPEGFGVFERHGDDLVIAWDPSDPRDSLVVRMTYSLVKALAAKEAVSEENDTEAKGAIEEVVESLLQQLKRLDGITTSAMTARNAADKILKFAEQMRTEMEASVDSLRDVSAALEK
jgi:hypothetical protein